MSGGADDLVAAWTEPSAPAGGSGALEAVDRRPVLWRQVAIALAAVVAAAVVVWVTWRAEFLAHPKVLRSEKADFILGPVFVGLYRTCAIAWVPWTAAF
jgi:hypothetical protein